MYWCSVCVCVWIDVSAMCVMVGLLTECHWVFCFVVASLPPLSLSSSSISEWRFCCCLCVCDSTQIQSTLHFRPYDVLRCTSSVCLTHKHTIQSNWNQKNTFECDGTVCEFSIKCVTKCVPLDNRNLFGGGVMMMLLFCLAEHMTTASFVYMREIESERKITTLHFDGSNLPENAFFFLPPFNFHYIKYAQLLSILLRS